MPYPSLTNVCPVERSSPFCRPYSCTGALLLLMNGVRLVPTEPLIPPVSRTSRRAADPASLSASCTLVPRAAEASARSRLCSSISRLVVGKHRYWLEIRPAPMSNVCSVPEPSAQGRDFTAICGSGMQRSSGPRSTTGPGAVPGRGRSC